MRAITLFICIFASAVSQALPAIEAILQANNTPNQRFGTANNTPGVKCSLSGNQDDPNYQYVLAGGVQAQGSPVWYTPYGGPDGTFDIQFWSLNPETNSMAFAYNPQGDTVTFTYDPQTLIVTGYTENFTSLGYGINSCVLDQ